MLALDAVRDAVASLMVYEYGELERETAGLRRSWRRIGGVRRGRRAQLPAQLYTSTPYVHNNLKSSN